MKTYLTELVPEKVIIGKMKLEWIFGKSYKVRLDVRCTAKRAAVLHVFKTRELGNVPHTLHLMKIF